MVSACAKGRALPQAKLGYPFLPQQQAAVGPITFSAVGQKVLRGFSSLWAETPRLTAQQPISV